MRAVVAISLVCSALAGLNVQKTKLDINQSVEIEGNPVLGKGTGQDRLGNCVNLAAHFVNNPNAPAVKVCGTGVKITVFLLGRCGEGSLTTASKAHTWEIGACDSGMDPKTCVSKSPADDKAMGASQSYRITQC